MGRGNVCTTGPYEGLFYIDNADLRVYRRNGPTDDEYEDRLMRDLDYSDILGPDWYFDEIGSCYEEEDVLDCFCRKMRDICPSFEEVDKEVWIGRNRRVILENQLFYICVEDNEWSAAVELIQKDGYSDCQQAWLTGLQRIRYKKYLDAMKIALLSRLPSIGTYAGAYSSGKIERSPEKV